MLTGTLCRRAARSVQLNVTGNVELSTGDNEQALVYKGMCWTESRVL